MQRGCPNCGRMVDENLKTCPYCNYNFAQLDEYFEKVQKQRFLETGKYSGFVKRLIAGLIDIYIVLFITFIISSFLNKYMGINYQIIFPILFILIYVISLAIFERTDWHGSIGKIIVGIEVVDQYENPITFSAALIRNIAKFINVLTLGIGFIICAAPPKNQTLGDKFTNTYVINKISLTEEKQHDYASLSKRFLAYLIDLIIVLAVSYGLVYVYSYLLNKISLPSFLVENQIAIKKYIPVIIYLIYFPYNECHRGKTVGKRYLKISLTNVDENNVSFILSFVRAVLIVLDILTLGFLLPTFNKKKQTVKDVITNTININD